jgi:peptidoglycan/xylan/chitin deacetylase (PgdA/CDA1 family)
LRFVRFTAPSGKALHRNGHPPLKTHLKKLIKASLASAGYSTGLLQRYVASRLSGRAAVLMYHRVLPAELAARTFSTDGIVVTAEAFRMQMRVVREQLNPLTIAQFARCMREGIFPDRACLVTFDDGWYDNREYALPILREMQVPAVVFLATDYVGTGECFWQERLSQMLHFGLESDPEVRRSLSESLQVDLESARGAPDRRAAARKLVDQVKRLPAARIRAAVDQAAAILARVGGYSDNRSVDRFMDWTDAQALHCDATFAIGSHCCTHTPLTKLEPAEVVNELDRSGARIAQMTGSRPVTMAYPNGDCSTAIAAATRDAGYELAFTTERGYVAPGDAPQQLRRINVHEHSAATPGLFLARIALLH